MTNDLSKPDRRTFLRRGAMGAGAFWVLSLQELAARSAHRRAGRRQRRESVRAHQPEAGSEHRARVVEASRRFPLLVLQLDRRPRCRTASPAPTSTTAWPSSTNGTRRDDRDDDDDDRPGISPTDARRDGDDDDAVRRRHDRARSSSCATTREVPVRSTSTTIRELPTPPMAFDRQRRHDQPDLRYRRTANGRPPGRALPAPFATAPAA